MTNLPTETNETDDAALIRRYAEEGDEEALGEFFRRYSDFAFRMACRVLRNPSEAEDAVQAAFVTVMRRAPNYRGGEGVGSWIAQIVINTSRDMIHKAAHRRGREEQYVESEKLTTDPEPESDAASVMARRVKALLDRMPEKYRLPVWLHHHEGMAFHAVARTLRLPEGTVRSQASRGLDMLRRAMARSGMAVSSMVLLDVLPKMPVESAPASLGQSLASLAESGSGSAAGSAGGGARMAASGVSASSAGLKPLVIGALALGAVGLGGGLIYFTRQDQPELAVLAANDMGLSLYDDLSEYSWDFNSDEWPPDLKVFQGSYRHRPDGGVDNSGCFETGDDKFEMLLDVPIRRLPVLVSFDVAQHAHAPEGGHSQFVWPVRHGPVAMFDGLSDHPEARIKQGTRYSDFVTRHVFVTADFMVGYSGSHLHTIVAGEPLRDEQGDIRLFLHIRGRQKIDNVTIRTLAPNDPVAMPDIAPHLAALSEIPPELRTGAIALPQLKPGRYFQAVTVRFAEGRIMDPAAAARLSGLPWPE